MNYYERIRYDAATGSFVWAMSAPGISAGKPAGSVSKNGYRVVKIGRKQVRAGRLAWFLSHGQWPAGEIDHINGDRLDDRLANLRVVDRAGNSQNKRCAQANNRSCGLLGVTWNKQHQRWQAKIMANKVRHHVGLFDTAQAAHAAYLQKKRQLHAGCTI